MKADRQISIKLHCSGQEHENSACERRSARLLSGVHWLSAAEQSFQLLACGGGAAVRFLLRRPVPGREFEILAEVCHVLLSHGLGAGVPALSRHARVVADAVEADVQVVAAAVAAFRAGRLAGHRVFSSAVMAMSRHGRSVKGGPEFSSREMSKTAAVFCFSRCPRA